jgi:hypothetical protein
MWCNTAEPVVMRKQVRDGDALELVRELLR